MKGRVSTGVARFLHCRPWRAAHVRRAECCRRSRAGPGRRLRGLHLRRHPVRRSGLDGSYDRGVRQRHRADLSLGNRLGQRRLQRWWQRSLQRIHLGTPGAGYKAAGRVERGSHLLAGADRLDTHGAGDAGLSLADHRRGRADRGIHGRGGGYAGLHGDGRHPRLRGLRARLDRPELVRGYHPAAASSRRSRVDNQIGALDSFDVDAISLTTVDPPDPRCAKLRAKLRKAKGRRRSRAQDPQEAEEERLLSRARLSRRRTRSAVASGGRCCRPRRSPSPRGASPPSRSAWLRITRFRADSNGPLVVSQ